MPLDDYLVGVAFFAITLGSVLAAAALVVRRRLPQLTGSTRLLALALIATAGLIGVHVVPGALYILSREAVAGAALLALLAASRLRPVEHAAPSGYPEPAARSSPTAWALAAV